MVDLAVISLALPCRPKTGFRAGAKEGIISLANSRTNTAPSCLLNFSTISYIPYLSTSAARLGWTSHIVLRMRKSVSRTTALLWPNRSMMRLKNCALAIPIVMPLDRRQIFKKGSNRFSKELALAVTKHLRRDSSAFSLVSTSSTRAVSSCSLCHKS